MKWITAAMAALVLSLPLVFAEETAPKISAWDMRFKQLGQAFGDFAYHVRAFLTFDEKAKVGLLKERNAEMKARQQAWLEIKAEAHERFSAENLTAEEKREITDALRAEHEAIIKEHLRLTAEIREIQLKAKDRGNSELEAAAEAEAPEIEESGLAVGLHHKSHAESGTSVTAEEAQALVEKRLGLEAVDVKAEVRNGAVVYVVTGRESKEASAYALERSAEVQVEPETGALVAVNLDTRIERRG